MSSVNLFSAFASYTEGKRQGIRTLKSDQTPVIFRILPDKRTSRTMTTSPFALVMEMRPWTPLVFS